MLRRVADTLYWAARDMERALTVTRVLEVGHAISVEAPARNGAGHTALWEPIVDVAADSERFLARHRRADARSVPWYLIRSDANPDSIAACLARARARLRAVRSRLPTEVFEAVSSIDIAAGAWSAQRITRSGIYAFCHEVRDGLARFDGVLDRFVRRDELWHLLRLGRHMERAIGVVRLLRAHRRSAAAADPPVGLGDWRTLLRSVASYEAYLRVGMHGPDAVPPVTFLLRDPEIPSSVAYCLGEIMGSLERLRLVTGIDTGAPPRAAVNGATRAAAFASRPVAGDEPLAALAVRLDEIHHAFELMFIPVEEVADDAVHAQAVRQAQN